MRKRKTEWGIYATALIMMGVIGINSSLATIGAAFPDISKTMVQSLLSVPCIAIIPTTIIAGKLMSKMSKKKLLLVGAICFTLGGTLPFFMHSFYAILAMRAVLGVGIGITQVLATAILVDIFSGEESQKAQGRLQTAQMLGAAFMVFTGGRLADIQWNLAFLIHLIGVISIVAVCILIPSKMPAETVAVSGEQNEPAISETQISADVSGKQTAEAEKLSRRQQATSAVNKNASARLTGKTWFWTVFMCLFFIMVQIYHVTFSYLIVEKNLGSASASGTAIVFFSLAGAVMGILYGRFSRIVKDFTIMIGCMECCLSYILIASAGSIQICYIGSILFGMGLVTALPRIFIQAGNSVAPVLSGFAVSLVTCAQNFGQFICPYLINPVSRIFAGNGSTSTVCFMIGIIWAACLAILMTGWAIVKRRKHQEKVAVHPQPGSLGA